MHYLKLISTILIFSLFGLTSITGQIYFTKNAQIKFYSEAPLENIEAFNSKGMSVLDLETKKIEFAVLIKAFQFKKALMQDHFNENYLESHKYPKALFKGQFQELEDNINSSPKISKVGFDGELTIHGITNSFSSVVDLSNKWGKSQVTRRISRRSCWQSEQVIFP